MKYRIEKDTMGEVKVPSDKLWGAQTERSRNNFKIGPSASMPLEVVYGFAYLKKAAAYANHELGVLELKKRDFIQKTYLVCSYYKFFSNSNSLGHLIRISLNFLNHFHLFYNGYLSLHMEYGHNGPGALYDPTHKELNISLNCRHLTHLKIN